MSDEIPEDVSARNPDGASGTARLSSAPDGTRPPRLPFPVVGIGASAGGLEACTEFIQAIPPKPGMAFVLVQHLPPDRDSLIAELLSKHTRLPVMVVEDGQKVEEDHFYVIRPGHTLTLRDGRLHLGHPVTARGHGRPVDDFFRSLAEEQQQRAIAVILSGMGSNGTAGAEAIEAVGGLVVAQDPESAKFPSMPRSLIDANLADFILRPGDMPEVLIRYAGHVYVAVDSLGDAVARREAQTLAEILGVLRTRTRHDFTGYRTPTLLRRVLRRMGLGQVATMGEYATMLRKSGSEVNALADDLLIHVTGFFRDPEAWEVVRDKVIYPLVAERAEGDSIRCWVTACATGEEAYTLAMLLVEAAESREKVFDIKVFATDMAERALSHARAGLFAGGIESEITPERLERFFDRDDSMYRVKRELREVVVFAPQNVLQDPPFSRIDIASCRNLLIYLEPAMQQRVLSVLHFGLREGGALLLGSTESVGPGDVQFEVLDKKHRLYRRVGPSRAGALEGPLMATRSRQAGVGNSLHRAVRPTVAQAANRLLMDAHTPAAVVVDEAGQVVYFHGNTSRYLEQPAGEPTRDLVQLANDQVRGSVRMVLLRIVESELPVTVRDGLVETPQGRRRIEIGGALLDPRAAGNHYLITFRDYPEPLAPPPSANGLPVDEQQLVEELQRVRDELQGTLEEMQASNEEMKASHEEVSSINEELQSTNEELETSKEEMQSLNEELTTLNAQLQAKMAELEATTNDLGSLLSSTDIAVLFLDRRFRIRRFTPAMRDLIDLIPSDAGRPLVDMRLKFADDELMADASKVLDRLVPVEREIESESDREYLRRVLPYRTADNRIDGVVVVFVDVTERKRAEVSIRASEEQFRRAIEEAPIPVIMQAEGGQVLQVSHTWTDLTGYTLSDVPTQDAWLTKAYGPGADDVRAHTHELFRGELKTLDVEFMIRTRSGGERHWSFSASAPGALADGRRFLVGMAVDITDRSRAEEEVRKAEMRLRLCLVAARMGVWTWDPVADVHSRDGSLNQLLGLAREPTRTPFSEFLSRVHPDDRGRVAESFDASFRQGQELKDEFRIVWADGSEHWLRDQGDVFVEEGRTLLSGACLDITDLKAAEFALRHAHDDLDQRVRDRTAELAAAMETLRAEMSQRKAAEEERRALQVRLGETQEMERRRISRELHDSLGQYVAALSLELTAARAATRDPAQLKRFETLGELASEIGRESHRLALELRPTSLDDLGLPSAVQNYVEAWSTRTGIPVDFHSRGPDERFMHPAATVIFRVVQEALTNIFRHARATSVSVYLERGPTFVSVIVEDDGVGFEPDGMLEPKRTRPGLGLLGMRERVALADGTVQVESTPGGGTTIFVRIPVSPEELSHE